MKYLLDTHVLIWAETAPETLSWAARMVLDEPSSTLYLSAASAQEIAIKWQSGKLALPMPPAEFVATCIKQSRLLPLPITIAHAVHVATLSNIHADPFDRILIAQAQLEGMTLLTRDRWILKYPVATLAA